jgi:hypothetical protein
MAGRGTWVASTARGPTCGTLRPPGGGGGWRSHEPGRLDQPGGDYDGWPAVLAIPEVRAANGPTIDHPTTGGVRPTPGTPSPGARRGVSTRATASRPCSMASSSTLRAPSKGHGTPAGANSATAPFEDTEGGAGPRGRTDDLVRQIIRRTRTCRPGRSGSAREIDGARLLRGALRPLARHRAGGEVTVVTRGCPTAT